MAGRIRTLKPEILEKARTAELPDDAWRLFVSMILLADDYGNLDGHPKRLESAVFWGAPVSRDIRDMLARLTRAELVELYTVRDQEFVSIVGWKEHQRVDHKGKPRVPQPTREPRETVTKPSRESQEGLAPDLRSGPPTSDPDPLVRARVVSELETQLAPRGMAMAGGIGELADEIVRISSQYGEPVSLVTRVLEAFTKEASTWRIPRPPRPDLVTKHIRNGTITAILSGHEPEAEHGTAPARPAPTEEYIPPKRTGVAPPDDWGKL